MPKYYLANGIDDPVEIISLSYASRDNEICFWTTNNGYSKKQFVTGWVFVEEGDPDFSTYTEKELHEYLLENYSEEYYEEKE